MVRSRSFGEFVQQSGLVDIALMSTTGFLSFPVPAEVFARSAEAFKETCNET